MITAFNRAEGAFLSDDPAFEQLQLDAFNTFQMQLGTDILNAGLDYNQFVSLFGGQFPDIFGDFGDQLISDAAILAGSSTSVKEPSSLIVILSGIAVLFGVAVVRRRRAAALGIAA
jgi:hypothetical protein